MKAFRIALHSLVLTLADLAGIAGGALAAFQVLGVPNQVWLQLPIAVALSVACFGAWILLIRVVRCHGLQLAGQKEFGTCLTVSLLWAPAVFLPLHYFTQGYLTSIGNFVAIVVYQLPVNSLALLCARMLRGPGTAPPPPASDQANTNAPRG